ncbi:MAG: hypothetical protein ACPHF2_02195 [Crocinitomicaceae bacterium]
MPISPNPVPQGGAVGEKMHKVYLEDLSPAQRSRMRNGHKVRAKLSRAEGKGCSCMMNEGTIKKLLKKGGKGEVSLSGGEIEANKISGTGLIEGGKGVKKFLKKHNVGRKVLNTLKSEPVQAIKKQGFDMLADAAIAGLVAEGVPAPIAKKGVDALEGYVDKKTGGAIRKKRGPIRPTGPHRSPYEDQGPSESDPTQIPRHIVGHPAKRKSLKGGATTRGQARAQERQKRCSSAGTELRACHKDGLHGRGLYARSSGRGLYGTGVYAAGGAIGKAERVTNIGAGGNLIHGQNPALRPQAGDANFFLQFYGGVPPSALPDY